MRRQSGKETLELVFVKEEEVARMWMKKRVRWSPHQGFVLHVLSQQAVVIQGVLGLAGHSVYWAFIHLVLYGPEEHVKRLPCRVLHKGGGEMKQLEATQSQREFFSGQAPYFTIVFPNTP